MYSDVIDLIFVVQDCAVPWNERPLLFSDVLSLASPTDLLVYTEDEFQEKDKNMGSFFWKNSFFEECSQR